MPDSIRVEPARIDLATVGDDQVPAPDAAAAIRASGLRVTDSRRAVFEVLRENPHASAEAVYRLVAPVLERPSLQSVYNALNDFADTGLARRIEPAGRPQLFELRRGDNHHHLVCTSCGLVADVDCVVGSAPCLTPSDAQGFRVREAEVTFWGECASCAAADDDAGAVEASV